MKSRTRIVNFRVTDEEYDKLKTACEVQGSRCISDFARTALLALSQAHTAPDVSTQGRLSVLDEKISSLGSGIYRLIELLDPDLARARRQRAMAQGMSPVR